MDFPRKQLILVGDRVLIAPEEGEERTRVGLYLPATAVDAQQVQSGLVIAVGPGDPAPDLASLDDELRAAAEAAGVALVGLPT